MTCPCETPVHGISPHGPILLGAFAALVLVLGIGLWAATVPIDGAILASGEVDAASQRHLVQHATGGIVAELAVREGQDVAAGALLLRLEGGTLNEEWALIESQLAEARARALRLTAERDGALLVAPPTPPPDARDDPVTDRAFRRALTAQQSLFQARSETLQRQAQQIGQRRVQLDAQLAGLAAQDSALAAEGVLLAEELANQQTLRARGLTEASRVVALGRESARLDGSRAALSARMAELRGQIVELELQVDTLIATHRTEAETQLAELGVGLLELSARRAILAERRAALTLRAPVAGTVHGLAALAPGAVLRAAETAMQIVARAQHPVLALRVRPTDIDHVSAGQSVRVRFPALAQTLPELSVTVLTISAAPFVDERSGARFYRIEATLSDDALAALDGQSLRPGLAVEAFLSTGARTPLAYLFAPITDHLDRALREP